MFRLFYIFTILLTITFSTANAATIPEQLQGEYGNCFRKFQDNLAGCTPSICNYPDLNDAKSWRAQSVRGIVNDKCYVIYYSYIGNQVTGEPQHCFYNQQQLQNLAQAYKDLFYTDSAISVIDLKSKINQLSYVDCKQKDDSK